MFGALQSMVSVTVWGSVVLLQNSSQMCTVALFTFSVFNDGIGEIFFMLVCLIKKKKKKKFIFFVILLFFLLFCCQLSASGGKISADVLYMSFENIYIVRYDPVHV